MRALPGPPEIPLAKSGRSRLQATLMGLHSRLLLVVAVFVLAFAALGQEADLVVTKSAPGVAAADTDVTFDIQVLNLGADDATAVTLFDTFPAGMTYVSHTADPGFSCSPPTPTTDLTCTAATMTAGATANFSITLHIPPATPPGTEFTNTATVSSQTFDPNDENNSSTASVSTPPPPQPDMYVQKSAPSSAGPNTDVTFTITVGNASPDTASNVTFTDVVGGTMTFVSFTQDSGPTLSCNSLNGGDPINITCTAASFPGNGTATFTLVGHIPTATPSGTSFTNTANVSADNDQNNVNDSAQTITTVSSVDVSVDKNTTTPAVNAGDPVSYTITVTNGGPDTAINAAFTDTLPPNTTFVSLTQDTGPSANCSTLPSGGTGTVGCNIPTLANGQSAQFTLVVTAGDTTSITNTATVSTDSFDSNSANDSDSATTIVTPVSDLAIVKNGPVSVVAGTDLTYTINVSNNGPSTASNVTVTDTVPPNTTYVNATASQGSCSGTTTVTCNLGTLAASASATVTLVVHVDVNFAGPVVNTATVASTTTDPNANNNSSTATAPVTPAPVDLSITKVAESNTVLIGENFSYTITVSNAGPGTATNTIVTDTIPANTTLVSATPSQGSCSGNPAVTCNLGTLTAGANATITLVVTAPSTPQPIVNTATVASNETDGNPVNNTSTSTINAATLPADVPTLSPFAMALLALALGIAMVLKAR
jgi:uncharacterized repeat protein (TIGR01451 family)